MQQWWKQTYSTCERTATIQTEEEDQDDSPDYAIDQQYSNGVKTIREFLQTIGYSILL
ncbi:hypothetical protein DPMN_124919 [Dreissena polymorpha]|uniref:Uncharacterized protein n=1 Tax=Dreissena polymorpha TaxID=45954 RepID=A0A9D4GU59_DREPO|nr:hypothetical protein DPMN_124919 [Dreissena polymorpha]